MVAHQCELCDVHVFAWILCAEYAELGLALFFSYRYGLCTSVCFERVCECTRARALLLTVTL